MKHIEIIVFVFLLIGCSNKKELNKTPGRPNIILIMADDMGYSDLGCYGSEIETPNLDRLANHGIRYTQFHNTGRCCPTRASLMTGLYPHQTGMGWMTAANLGYPGYAGDLNNQCVTIAEVLTEAGYSTYMAGKWHVVYDKFMEPEGPKHNWPLQRGFNKYYGPINGGGSYFTTKYLTYGNQRIEPPENYYLTEAISDSSVSFINRHLKENNGNPFFLYVAYTAPHFPLHAKDIDIQKYLGKYLFGWDQLRKQRYQRMLDLGIIDSLHVLSEFEEDVRKWNELNKEEQTEFDRRMAVYAAQIDNMDQGIGRIIGALTKQNRLDNTLIVFLSDNGGTMEHISRSEVDTDLIGSDSSYESYRKPWATVSNTPYRKFKQWVHEGGTITPLIVHWPNKITHGGQISQQVGHVIDMMPTFVEIAQAEYPEVRKDNDILPMEGISLASSFTGEVRPRGAIFWEHQATRAIRLGDWKLVADKTNEPPYTLPWELYDLISDPSESQNLASIHPDLVDSLSVMWQHWAKRCNVFPLDGRSWFPRLEE